MKKFFVVLLILLCLLCVACSSEESVEDEPYYRIVDMVNVEQIAMFYTGLIDFRLPQTFPNWISFGWEELSTVRAFYSSVERYWHFLSATEVTREELSEWVLSGHIYESELTEEVYEVRYTGQYGRVPTISVSGREVALVLMDPVFADEWIQTRFFGPYSVEILQVLEDPATMEVSVVAESSFGTLTQIIMRFDENYVLVETSITPLEFVLEGD